VTTVSSPTAAIADSALIDAGLCCASPHLGTAFVLRSGPSHQADAPESVTLMTEKYPGRHLR